MATETATRDDRAVLKNTLLLVGIIVHLLIDPLSRPGGAGPALFYLYYALLFMVGVFWLDRSTPWRIAGVCTGLAVGVAGLVNSYAPGPAAALAVYLTSLAYHGVIIGTLIRYVFGAKQVMTEILLAATSLYLVIGSACAAGFALVEWLVPGSFTSSSGAVIDWQLLLYYSYVTLTTVGYGDVTPVGFYAQTLAAFEAILGVLYTVILLARLVGMHAARPE